MVITQYEIGLLPVSTRETYIKLTDTEKEYYYTMSALQREQYLLTKVCNIFCSCALRMQALRSEESYCIQLLATATNASNIASYNERLLQCTTKIQEINNLRHWNGGAARDEIYSKYLVDSEPASFNSMLSLNQTKFRYPLRDINTLIARNLPDQHKSISERADLLEQIHELHLRFDSLCEVGYERKLAEEWEAGRLERERLAYLATLARLAREKANREAAESLRKANQCLILTSDHKAIQAQDEETLRERIVEEGKECFILTPEDIAENGTVWEEYDLRGVTPSFTGEDCEAKRAELKEKNIRKEELERQYKIGMADQLLMEEEKGREFVQRAILSAQKVAQDEINKALLQCQTVDDPEVRKLVLQSVASDAQKLAQNYLDGLFKDRGIYEPVSGENNYMEGEPEPVIAI